MIEQLLSLWKQAFGEHNGFWEMFLETGFSRDRCAFLTEDNTICAALCWFDLEIRGQKWAYLYAVVTAPEFRGRGLCRKLLARSEAQWEKMGYAGALLVPADEGLRAMYGKLGYETCTYVTEFSCAPGDKPAALTTLSRLEYARLRRARLPEGGAVQEGENLTFLSAQAELLGSEDVLLAAWQEEGVLHAMELLGDPAKAPGIVTALGCQKGIFRTPGGKIPFAMGKKLRPEADFPTYFGLAFD